MDVGLLFDFVAFDAGERAVGFCGPSAAARLAAACRPLWTCLPRSVLVSTCAALPEPADEEVTSDRDRCFLEPAAIAAAFESQAPDKLPGGRLLAAFCRATARSWSRQRGQDEVFRLLAHGAEPGRPSLMWARALQRGDLAALLEQEALARGRSIGWTQTEADAEVFFRQLLQGSVAGAASCLACGCTVASEGSLVVNQRRDDPGCCRWTPLAAACEGSSRRRAGAATVALLLAARADCNAPCPGPCGLTPLMVASSAGSEEACRLLMRAGADARPRHAPTGATALEMAKKGSNAARVIREERERRSAAAEAAAAAAAVAMPAREGRGGAVAATGGAKGGKDGGSKKAALKRPSPALLALAAFGLGSSGAVHGKSQGAGNSGSR